MSQDPNPGGNPGGQHDPVVTTPVPTGDNSAANAAFAKMRTELDAALKQIETLAAEKTALERKDMDEKTRLAAELEDARKKAQELEPARDALGRYQSQIEQACANELASIPEDKRAAIEAVVSQIPLEGRLTAIQSMRTVAGAAPITAGAPTAPGAGPGGNLPAAEQPAKPLTMEEMRKTSLGDAVKMRGVQSSTASLEKLVADLSKKVEALTGSK